jgi:decaprenylphospho-beta-D-ribofuranose 2-oxidase
MLLRPEKTRMSGWGRFPVNLVDRQCYFDDEAALRRQVLSVAECIPRGLGRSYGDSSLGRNVILTSRSTRFLEFDEAEGVLECQGGVPLGEMADSLIPRGWFLPVTPGTKYVSIGGAIAADVHGKNHHKDGSFGEYVLDFHLMLADGSTVKCSRRENSELFRATCGGMGLTGIIVKCRIKLRRIASSQIRQTLRKAQNLAEVFDLFEECENHTYSVAWIDCLARGDALGRSILFIGEHETSGFLEGLQQPRFSVPFATPGCLLNRTTVSLFNTAYYAKARDGESLVSLDSFFYPLDCIGNWNLLYGKGGFTQYQFVLPKESSAEGLRLILSRIADSGLGCFLGVLKLLGPANGNWLSFPMEGYTLALDFKIHERLFPFLDELDTVVLDHGGRIYLAKDARMSQDTFRAGYPNWPRFASLREKYGADRKFRSVQSVRLGL